jgi:hypothetical protein
VPETRGEWALEADLNDGQADDRCLFRVERPQVEIWLPNGCGVEYELGDVVEIYYQATVEDVVIALLDGEEWLFERAVTAEVLSAEKWEVSGALGEHTLSALLQEWGASDECPFYVADRTPPPAPVPLKPWDGTEFTCTSEAMSAMLRWEAVTDLSGIAYYEVELVETPDYPPVPTTSTLQLESNQAQALVSGACGDAYSWRVRAIDGAENEGDWSEMRSFRFMTLSESDTVPPPTPYAVSPGGLSSSASTNSYPCESVILDWYDVYDDLSGTMAYRVTLQEYDFSSEEWQSIEPYYLIYSTYIDVAEWLSTNRRYRWRVWAIDNATNHGDPSAWRYFYCPTG